MNKQLGAAVHHMNTSFPQNFSVWSLKRWQVGIITWNLKGCENSHLLETEHITHLNQPEPA